MKISKVRDYASLNIRSLRLFVCPVCTSYRHGIYSRDLVLEDGTSIRLKLHGERWHHSTHAYQRNCEKYGDIAFKSSY